MIKRLEHVALSVSDLDRSIAFYCDIIGLKLLRIIEANTKIGLGDIVGLPDCKARIAHLLLDNFMLELFEYKNPRGRSIPGDFIQADNGFIHIGFQSTDVKKDYLTLKEKGVKFFNKPVEFRPEVWVVYFYGPDGEVCELRQE